MQHVIEAQQKPLEVQLQRTDTQRKLLEELPAQVEFVAKDSEKEAKPGTECRRRKSPEIHVSVLRTVG